MAVSIGKQFGLPFGVEYENYTIFAKNGNLFCRQRS
jgi:hypothetical protein